MAGLHQYRPSFGPVRADVDLDTLLDIATGDTFSYCRGKFRLRAPHDMPLVDCSALLDPDVFRRIIDTYAQKYPGADRRAVVSMWTLHYFSSLTISAAVYRLVLRRTLPLALADVQLLMDPDSAEPRGFVLPHAGVEDRDAGIHAGLHAMIRDHAEPLIAFLAAEVGLAKKLLWTNVSAYLSWIIKEIGHQVDPELTREGMPLVADPAWPDGWKNPLLGMIVAARQQCGLEFSRRKVCCLRYALPGVAHCGEACPLPDGRRL